MNPVRLNIQSLKYQTITLSESKDIAIQKHVCDKDSIPKGFFYTISNIYLEGKKLSDI